MRAPRNRRHLVVRRAPKTEEYTPHPRKIELPEVQGPKNRRLHAQALKKALVIAEREARSDRAEIGIQVEGAQPGLYIRFESSADVDLNLKSLEDLRQGIELVAVQRAEHAGAIFEYATVFVPEGKLKHFFGRFEGYASKKTESGEPRYKDMLDRVATLRRATLRALWTDAEDAYPADDEVIWWEVWLRRREDGELERMREFARQAGMEVGKSHLAFDERTVMLVKGSSQQLSASIDVLNDVAEVQRAKETAAFFLDQGTVEQREWADDLRRRSSPPPDGAPAVCVLDTGVTRAHPLLDALIARDDAMAVDPAWGPGDDGGGRHLMGHGTEMAGLAAYGDLTTALGSKAPVLLKHRIESVKILPPRGANLPEVYGAITAQAVARPEIQAPHRPRVFSLAVTSTDRRDRGQPTSWSAAIDALAVGRSFDTTPDGLDYLRPSEAAAHRLFVISAGNVDPPLDVAHLDRSDLDAVHDPAQAWNALTVGAFTRKAVVSDPKRAGWSGLAPLGELSPWSTTSVRFAGTWPIKPDIVYEGGNVGFNGKQFDFPVPDLCLLSTYFRPAQRLFELSFATSAASAQIARMAILVRVDYPDFWPETVRALLVHSAEWTPAMRSHLRVNSSRGARAALARRYGAGVPDLERARRSADDALTLVVQSVIHPFQKRKMRQMHLHALPWPKEALGELGAASVRLRVTLSYFVEPNPGRRGWEKRHRYASHGLRFEVKSATESIDEFRKRVNQRALDEEEERPHTGGDSEGWFLGERTRNKGSLHSDTWSGSAADLAECGVIAVYPVSGWWKDQPKRDKSDAGARYALIVSIETEAEGVDIWTPVAQEIGVPVEIATEL